MMRFIPNIYIIVAGSWRVGESAETTYITTYEAKELAAKATKYHTTYVNI